MAAIKMDELLVHWLSSDGVYDSIIGLIESHQRSTSSSVKSANGGSNAVVGGGERNGGNSGNNGNGSTSPVSPTRGSRALTSMTQQHSGIPSGAPELGDDNSEMSMTNPNNYDPFASPTPTINRKGGSNTTQQQQQGGGGLVVGRPPTSPKTSPRGGGVGNAGGTLSSPSSSSSATQRKGGTGAAGESDGGSNGDDTNDNPSSTSEEEEEKDGELPPPPPPPPVNVEIPPFYDPKEGVRGRGRKPLPDENQTWMDLTRSNPVLRQAFALPATVSTERVSPVPSSSLGTSTPPPPPPPPPFSADDGSGGVEDGSTNMTSSSSLSSVVLSLGEFLPITKDVCNFPSFFNAPLYRRIIFLCGDDGNDINNNNDNQTEDEQSPLQLPAPAGITFKMFEEYWKNEMENYDAQDRFFRLVKKPDADYIMREDFLPFVEELLATHPGLEFLSNHAEFQEKYAVTVITRIFYCMGKHGGGHNGKITCRQMRRSDLLDSFHLADSEEDINKVTKYFSYEHFYVLYCRFWELDHDRDYLITREDLLKYGDHSLSHMIVDRIFEAAPRPFASSSIANAAATPQQTQQHQQQQQSAGENALQQQDQMQPASSNTVGINREYLSYEDFIFFMLSEEDKANEVSVRYWFTCIDVDGDGKLNNMEMRSFYAVQLHRMQCLGHEIVPFEDMLCQMMDMIKPKRLDYLVVEDFLQPECFQVSGALFDALFNLNKYLQFEQRDPFMERQKREDEFDCDWDRFACIDYNRLAMEEEAREEEAMEIDWVTVDDDEDDGDDFNSLGLGGASEAPF